MCAQATRLSKLKIKAAKPLEKDYVLVDGDGLQIRVRINGFKLWNFNYYHPVTKKRINMGLDRQFHTVLMKQRSLQAHQRYIHASHSVSACANTSLAASSC